MRRSTVFLAVSLVLVACGDGSITQGGNEPRSGWTRLPESLLSPRYQTLAFWTGAEVLLLGGRDSPPCPPNADCVPPDEPAFRGGASFDPSSASWQRIADAPVPIGFASGAVVDGTLYLYVPGYTWEVDARTSFLSYDPGADRWEELPTPPLPEDMSVSLVAMDGQIAGFHGTQERGVRPDLVFDIGSRSWSELPRDPLVPSFDRWFVWSGDELILTAIEHVPNPGSEGPALYRAAAYDPTTASWRRLPDSEVVGYNPEWFWSGGRVVNPTTGSSDGGEVNGWDRSYPHGGMLDPATGAWSALPGSPPHEEDALTGLSLGSDGYAVSLDGWVLDTGAERWIPLSRPDGAATEAAAAVWAGDRLVLWGGVRWDGMEPTILGDGWSWAP